MAKVLINLTIPFEKSPGFGSTQWVDWFKEDDGTWTAWDRFKSLISTGHRCPVHVGMENGTASGSHRGTVVSVCPRYVGQGGWEWSTHLECDVPPLSDQRAMLGGDS